MDTNITTFFETPIPPDANSRRGPARTFRPGSSRRRSGFWALGRPDVHHFWRAICRGILLLGQPRDRSRGRWGCRNRPDRPRKIARILPFSLLSVRRGAEHPGRSSGRARRFAVRRRIARDICRRYIRHHAKLSREYLHNDPLRKVPIRFPRGHFGGSQQKGRWRAQIQRLCRPVATRFGISVVAIVRMGV